VGCARGVGALKRLFLCLGKRCASKPGSTPLWRNLLRTLQCNRLSFTTHGPLETVDCRRVPRKIPCLRGVLTKTLPKVKQWKERQLPKTTIYRSDCQDRFAIQDRTWRQCNKRRGISPWGTLPPIDNCGVRTSYESS